MTDKTWDVEDPRELPYRFVPSPVTGEVFVIGQGFRIMAYFENPPSFHRFLLEGIKIDDLIQEGVLKESLDILKDRQDFIL